MSLNENLDTVIKQAEINYRSILEVIYVYREEIVDRPL